MSRPRLQLQGVTKRFGGLLAVDSVDLVISAGERVGLIGPNGAGKTTLFGLIAGETGCDAGEVWFDGHRVEGLGQDRRARLGMARTG